MLLARKEKEGNAILRWIRGLRQCCCNKAVHCEEEEEEAKPSCSGQSWKNALSLDRFTLHEKLGKGAFGKVILAKDKVSHELAAMKFVKKKSFLKWRKDIMLERNILEVAKDCPFLTHAHGTFHTQGHLIYVMEYLSGGTLKRLIKKKGPLNIQTVKFLTAEMVCAIQFLHSRGIVHRDLKPENILLDSNGHIKIADFGLALEKTSEKTRVRGYAGTRGYMAPEMFKDVYNYSVDWWALGVIVYEMATGKHPFGYGGFNSLMKKVKAVTYPSFFGNELTDLLKNLWTIDPEVRILMEHNIRSHQFFNSIDWEKLELCALDPPFSLPPAKEVLKKKTKKPLKKGKKWFTSSEEQELFKGFLFVSPEWRNKFSHSTLNTTSGKENGNGSVIEMVKGNKVAVVAAVEVHHAADYAAEDADKAAHQVAADAATDKAADIATADDTTDKAADIATADDAVDIAGVVDQAAVDIAADAALDDSAAKDVADIKATDVSAADDVAVSDDAATHVAAHDAAADVSAEDRAADNTEVLVRAAADLEPADHAAVADVSDADHEAATDVTADYKTMNDASDVVADHTAEDDAANYVTADDTAVDEEYD